MTFFKDNLIIFNIYQIFLLIIIQSIDNLFQIVLKNPCCNETTYLDQNNEYCDPYDYNSYVDDVDTFTIVVGILMVIFSFVSVLPQIIKYVSKKSTQGISIHMYEMAMFNEYFTLLSTMLSMIDKLQADFSKSWPDFLSPMQQAAIWICYLTNYTQYIYYEHMELLQTYGLNRKSHQYNKTNITVKQHLIHVGIYLIFLFIMIFSIPASFLPGLFFGLCDPVYSTYLTIINCIAAIVGLFEWVPQIIKTYKIKSCGTFSVLAMAIQTPGVVINLFVLIATGTTWNVWLSTIVSAVLHIILLSQLCYYYFCYQGGEYKRNKKSQQ